MSAEVGALTADLVLLTHDVTTGWTYGVAVAVDAAADETGEVRYETWDLSRNAEDEGGGACAGVFGVGALVTWGGMMPCWWEAGGWRRVVPA